MIKIAGVETNIKDLLEKYPRNSAESDFLEKLSKSEKEYRYSSMDELIFETELRRNILRASTELYRGRLGFRTFDESKCNEAYWNREENGGFTLRRGVKASDAINDIFRNTRKYATECATAVVMVFYAAVLESYSADLFNSAFTEITLMNWMELDDLMGIATYRKVTDYFPGDCRYFRNPDVNPLTPEWQGENAVYMGGDLYYGHGIGMVSKEKIISTLNENRIEDAEASAYLMDTATRPNFFRLYQYKRHAGPFVTADPPAMPAQTAAAAAPATATPAAPASPTAAATPAAAPSAPASVAVPTAVSAPTAAPVVAPVSPAAVVTPAPAPAPHSAVPLPATVPSPSIPPA